MKPEMNDLAGKIMLVVIITVFPKGNAKVYFVVSHIEN